MKPTRQKSFTKFGKQELNKVSENQEEEEELESFKSDDSDSLTWENSMKYKDFT